MVYLPLRRFENWNFPLVSVLVSWTAPCSLFICTVIPAHGFASKSLIVPAIFPSCATAGGASQAVSPSVNIAASAYAFNNFAMLHSPFVVEEPRPRFAGRCVPIIAHSLQIPMCLATRSRTTGGVLTITDRIRHSRFRKGPEAQQATVALPPGPRFAS